MADVFATLDGHALKSLRVSVSNVGPWFAECELAEPLDTAPVGAVVIVLKGAELRGTVVDQHSGSFGLTRRLRVVGGGGGWGARLAPKNYHNDAGVKAQLVAEDAAREAGEAIGSFVPVAERIGRDFVRSRMEASRTLSHAAGGAPWYVDFAGLTHVGPRTTVALSADQYDVLAYDPISRIVTLAVEDPGVIRIGAVITESLDAPVTIREYDVHASPDSLRVMAWGGGGETEPGRLPGLLAAIARRTASDQLLGKYRYRVVSMAPDGRVNLQAVRKDAGLPDVLPISQWPGVPGVHALLTPGGEVLVEFIEGDRSQPIVTHYAGLGGAGFVPSSLVLGGETGAPAARQGDAVEVLLPPAIFAGSVLVGGVPSPATGVLTWVVPKALGIVTAGSSKVGIAS
jgi:hypothetical protein